MLQNHRNSSSQNAPAPVDRVLFKNLVEIVPLVESLMDRRANSSFTRRASMVYTPTPAQFNKVSDSRGRKSASAQKRRDPGSSDPNVSSGESENVQIDSYELTMLREQVDDFQRKLLEKEEALKAAEDSLNQMKSACASINELRHQVSEKEAMLKSVNSELNNAKIKLADKQAALEKVEWEAKMSNRKVEELQDNLVSMDLEIRALTQIFEVVLANNSDAYPVDKITSHYFEEPQPIDQLDEIEMMKMEHARTRYLAAVSAAKDNPSDESLAIAAEARLRLQAFVF